MNDNNNHNWKIRISNEIVTDAQVQIKLIEKHISKTEDKILKVDSDFTTINTLTQKALLKEFKETCLIFICGSAILIPVIYLFWHLIDKSSEFWFWHTISLAIFFVVTLIYGIIVFGFGLTACAVIKRWYSTLWLNDEQLLEFVETELRNKLELLDEEKKPYQSIIDENESLTKQYP